MIKSDFRVTTRSTIIIKIEINDIISDVQCTIFFNYCLLHYSYNIYTFSIILYLKSFNFHNIFKNNNTNKPYKY